MGDYVQKFVHAFPGESDPVTFDNMAKAIEAFEATLITPASRFDQFLEGNDAILTKTEMAGLELFIDTGCASCHNGGMSVAPVIIRSVLSNSRVRKSCRPMTRAALP